MPLSGERVDSERQGLYPERADVQASDHEAPMGDSVRLAGYTATLTGAELYTPEFGDPQVLVHVAPPERQPIAL